MPRNPPCIGVICGVQFRPVDFRSGTSGKQCLVYSLSLLHFAHCSARCFVRLRLRDALLTNL